MATGRKVTRVSSGDAPQRTSQFVPTAEAKAQAKKLRLLAVLCWVAAFTAQGFAIYWLFTKSEAANFMTMMIIFIVAALIFVVLGSVLFWKKANRLDPASEKDKTRFFIQNQLGLIIAVLCFLPLVILILTSKNLDGKQKGILGAVAGVALLVAGYFGIEFNPASIEKYTAEIQRMEELTGANEVFWTPSGTRYHVYEDCHAMARTEELFTGGVQDAFAARSAITGLCGHCENRAARLRGLEAPVEAEPPPPLVFAPAW